MKIRSSKVVPFLIFKGQAETAMNYYLSLFPKSELLSIKRYERGEVGVEGSVELARFSLNEQVFLCIDSPVKHDLNFDSAISFHVSCDSDQEIEKLFAQLSDQGTTMLPLDHHRLRSRFAWISDKFGTSWQLSLLPACAASHRARRQGSNPQIVG